MPNLIHTAPAEVMHLYSFHKRWAKEMGWPTRPLLEWARDREGLPGYEAVDRWLARLRERGTIK